MEDNGQGAAEEEVGNLIPESEEGPSNAVEDKEEDGDGGGDDDDEDDDEDDDDDDDDDSEEEDQDDDDDYEEDESEEGDEIEGEREAPQNLGRLDYEALAEKKRKALSDSRCDGSEKKVNNDANSISGMEEIMEFMRFSARRKSRKRKRRGKRKGSKKKATPEITRMLGEATLHYGHGRFSEAISVLEKVIHQAPDFADAYHTLGLVHHSLGKTELAMEAYKIAAAIKRQDSSLWKLLFEWSMPGQTNKEEFDIREKGDASSARNYASKAIKADPEDTLLRYQYATLCLDAGKDNKAAESYEQIFRHCPENVDALKWGAKLYLKCGQGERSASILEDYIKSNPSEVGRDVIDLLAAVFMKINAYDRALKYIQDVHQIYNPGKELTLNLKIREAICHVHIKEMEKAEILLSVLPQEVVSEHPELITELADVCMSTGNFHCALKYYHLLEANAGLVNGGYLLLQIARCYMALAEKAQAIAFFYKAVSELQDHIDARLTLASILLEDAKIEEAISVLSPPENPGPNDDTHKAWWHNRRIRMKLCQIYHSKGMLEDFVNLALQLALEWVWQKVQGKKKRPLPSLCEGMEQQRRRSHQRQRDSLASQLRGWRPKKMRKMRATLNETKRIRDRAAITAHGEDNSGEYEVEAIRDEEYHHLFVNLCKALASLQRYWEALEIVNLARRLDAKMLPVEKKKELQSLGAQISCDTMDPKQWFDCVRSVIYQHPYRLNAWNCYYRVISRLGKRASTEGKFIHHIRAKYRDCVPPILMAGHHFTLTRRHQDAAREYLEAYKLLPENPLINLCAGTALINLALGFRLQNKNQCLAQGFAFLYNNLRICNSSQEALYNIARAYHHVGLVTLAAACYEKVLAIYEKDYPMPRLPNEEPNTAEERRSVNCDLRREAAHNLHLIYKNSGAFDLARQVLKDHCTF